MFQQLSHYLLQFKRVTIPSVGTIQLVAQPARLDIASHLIYPPYYEATYSADDEISEHQLEYFAAGDDNTESAYGVLYKMGEQLKRKIQKAPWDWNGIGTFEYQNQQVFFHPQHAQTDLLPPVQAERVIHEKAQHEVLVGDQVVMSAEAGEQLYESRAARDYFVIAAWVLAILAVLFIAYYLYRHQFQSTASGWQQQVQPATEAPTYK